MAQEPDVSANLNRALNERLQNSDKQREIELYYELLSAGRSVGEILNSIGPVRAKAGHGHPVIAEHRQSGTDGTKPDGAASDMAAETVSAEAARAEPPAASGPSMTRDTERRGSGKPQVTESMPPDRPGSDSPGSDSPGSDSREPCLRGEVPGSEPEGAGAAGAHTPANPETAAPSGDPAAPRPGRLPNVAKRVAFGAVYTIAVAAASIAGFSIMHGGREPGPTIARARSDLSGGGGSGAVAMPDVAAARPGTAPEAPKAAGRVASIDISQPPEPSRSGAPEPAVPEPLSPVSAGIQGAVSAAPQPGEAPQRSAAGDRSVAETSTASAAALRDPAHQPVPSAALSLPVVPAAATDAVSHPDAGRPERDKKPEAASEDAKARAAMPATASAGTASAVLPARGHAAKERSGKTPRSHAEARRHIRQRKPSRSRQPVSYGRSSGPYDTDRRTGSLYAAPARDYGYGGPASYSDTGN